MTATIDKTPEQILTEAADLLDQGFWVQYSFHTVRADDGAVCHCADGALQQVSGVEIVVGVADKDPITEHLIDKTANTSEYLDASRPYRVAVTAAGIAAKQVGGYPYESIIGYNDEPGRTRGQVVGVLRAARDFIPEADARIPTAY